MHLAAIPEAGRAQGHLRAADARAVDGEREENVGISHVVVVKEVFRAGLKGVGIERPAAEGDRYTELAFFVALTVQGNKAQDSGW